MVTFAGVEGGGTSWRAAIAVDSPDNITEHASFQTTSPEETLGEIQAWLAQKQYDSLGIASFGPIDPKEGSPTYGQITTTPKPGWQFVDVVGNLRKPKIPCRFDTDVNAPALAEFLYDNPDKTTSLAYITVGTGVGVGLVVNGQTVNGLLHPEGGHVRVARAPGDTFEGTCPFHGDCVEGLASTGALAKRKGCTPSDLPSLSDDDELWVHAADAIAQLCANLVLTVSPERIVLGGGVMQRTCLYDMVRDRTQEILNGYISDPRIMTEKIADYIVPPKWSDRAGIVGALTLAKVGYENHSVVRRNRRRIRRRTAMVTLAACIVVPCVCVAVLLYPRAKRA